jgi:hypothetical protein
MSQNPIHGVAAWEVKIGIELTGPPATHFDYSHFEAIPILQIVAGVRTNLVG